MTNRINLIKELAKKSIFKKWTNSNFSIGNICPFCSEALNTRNNNLKGNILNLNDKKQKRCSICLCPPDICLEGKPFEESLYGFITRCIDIENQKIQNIPKKLRDIMIDVLIELAHTGDSTFNYKEFRKTVSIFEFKPIPTKKLKIKK